MAAKNDRPVFMLYLMHSYTSAASSTTDTSITQCMWNVPRAPMFGSRYASPPPTEMPKLIAWGPSMAIIPAMVSGKGSGTLCVGRVSDAATWSATVVVAIENLLA